MGATEFVRRLLGKPVMVEGADYSEDDWFEVPQADFRPVMAESNARALALAPESLAELDADLLTEDEAESEDEAAWEAALAAARSGALQSSLAAPAAPRVIPEKARPHRPAQTAAPAASHGPVSHSRSSRMPMAAASGRTSPRPSLADPLAHAAGLARAKAPVVAPVLTPARAESTSRPTRTMASASLAAGPSETTAVASPRRRREPTQQLVSRPTTVLHGPEVRRVDLTPAAPAVTASSTPARSHATAIGRRPAPSSAPAGKLLSSRPAPVARQAAAEKEDDWEAMIARAKGAAEPEPDWEAALRAAKARC